MLSITLVGWELWKCCISVCGVSHLSYTWFSETRSGYRAFWRGNLCFLNFDPRGLETKNPLLTRAVFGVYCAVSKFSGWLGIGFTVRVWIRHSQEHLHSPWHLHPHRPVHPTLCPQMQFLLPPPLVHREPPLFDGFTFDWDFQQVYRGVIACGVCERGDIWSLRWWPWILDAFWK